MIRLPFNLPDFDRGIVGGHEELRLKTSKGFLSIQPCWAGSGKYFVAYVDDKTHEYKTNYLDNPLEVLWLIHKYRTQLTHASNNDGPVN